ncbi:MAG: 16S rRNA (cytosine(967)-C(5))-methyltransferase RsmB [Clostridia bacterium]|nr:16S rRNA (cytosine(967)-C(5))-methyltransferase RsmB [Clostridia bacterium]
MTPNDDFSKNRAPARVEGRRGAPRSGANAERRPAPTRTGSARDAALSALGSVLKDRAYAGQALDRALSFYRLSPEDRRLAASLFYVCLEKRIYLNYVLDGLVEERPEPRVWDILHIAAAQILFMDRVPDHAAVDEAVKQVRAAQRGRLDKLVNGVLRNLIRARDDNALRLPDAQSEPEEFMSVSCSVAMPAVRRVTAAYGDALAREILSYVPEERTVTVRPNEERYTVEALEALLIQSGAKVRAGLVPGSLVVSGAGNPAALREYAKGLFSIQSEGSMLAALAVEPRRGMQILDACAAPGGKTCLMAERLQSSGRVFAWDVYPHRVELIRASARRLWLENVRPAEHDARVPHSGMERMMDAVLIDAPCSGLGVMNEKPDIRFRITDEEIEGLLPVQRDILENASKCVRQGGLLVYSTCTLLPEENERQVRSFLQNHPEFEPDVDTQWLPEALRDKCSEGMLQLLPSRDGVEGFFIARMRRGRRA